VNGLFLGIDLGAESGRAMLARFQSDVVTLEEIYRFANEPVRQNGSLHWDILRLWLEVTRALDRVSSLRLNSIGLDGWGCDFALLGEQGNLLENPYHYRDVRTDGVMEQVFARVSRERIYAETGVQFLQFNTLYQLYAAAQHTPKLIDAATTLLSIPDLLNYWLTGRVQAELTNATTTQFVDVRTRSWAADLLSELDLPIRLLPPLVEPGSMAGGLLRTVSADLAGTPVVVPGCHDTASAVASVRVSGGTAFLSSGTWSLLGVELPAPIVTPKARDLNFTNEGGVCGTTRLLKNISGLWLLQSCRRNWSAAGQHYGYDDLVTAAGRTPTAFRSLIDPDHQSFLHPKNMVASIAEYCRQTGQPEPDSPPAFVRCILESLAFKYRAVVESLESLTGTPIQLIRVVGGGARNRLLNQFTADATGRTVVAGPVEATVLGNVAMQMVATGAVASLGDARDVIDRSFPVERFEARDADRWQPHYQRFQDISQGQYRGA
jgi:rhamnulokinase